MLLDLIEVPFFKVSKVDSRKGFYSDAGSELINNFKGSCPHI